MNLAAIQRQRNTPPADVPVLVWTRAGTPTTCACGTPIAATDTAAVLPGGELACPDCVETD